MGAIRPGGSGGGGGTASAPAPIPIALAGYATCDGLLVDAGGARFDPALFARSGLTTALTLEVEADVSAAITGTIELYDLTAGSSAASLAVTSTTPGNAQTASVTLPGTARSYALRLSHDGTTSQYLTLRSAVLRVSWS